MKKLFIIVTFCFMQMMFSDLLFASSFQDFFVVKGISVSQSASSSSEAKKLALSSARDEAFNTVLKRLLVSSDISNVVVPDNYNMEKFIQTVKLNNEKTTSTSYSAVVDVQINKNLMSDYLKNQGFKVLEDLPPSTFLMFSDGYDYGFSDANYGNGNVVPFAGVGYSDLYSYDVDSASIDVFKSMLSKYNANNVIVVKVQSAGDVYNVSFKDKLLGINSSFKTNYEHFVTDLVLAINDAYKMATDEGDFGKSISMLVPIFGLSDWIDIEKIISKVSSIKSYEVQALKYNKAQLKLKYNYDLDSVINALRKAGLDVQNKNTYLIVKR